MKTIDSDIPIPQIVAFRAKLDGWLCIADTLRIGCTGEIKESQVNWLFAFLVLTAVCGIAGASRNTLAFEFAQGVIVDVTRSVVYMTSQGGRIDAVNLAAGEVIATSTRGAKPLLLYDDILLAQAKARDQVDVLSLVGLTAKDLKPKFEVDVRLPSQVRFGTFYAGARMDNDEIVVQWRSIFRRMSGVPTNEPARLTTGFALIDATDGRLIASGDGEPSNPRTSKDEIPIAVEKLVESGALASRLCTVDNVIAALQYADKNGEKHVTLRRWYKDTGEALPEIRLFGSELTFRDFSGDCRHLLASKGNAGWIWYIYSVVTGNLLAELHNRLPGPRFFIWEGSLIYQSPGAAEKISGRLKIEPPRLVALDLKSGEELWATPVGEADYVGPHPGHPGNPSTGNMGTEPK
jgi:hypothetical protein